MASEKLKCGAIRLRRILVPTDFSPASRLGFEHALAIAIEFEAELDLVHVVPVTMPAELSHIGIMLEQKRMAKEAKKELEKFAQEQAREGILLRTHLVEGPVSLSIVELAAKRKTDLIVTTTHGYTGLKHLWIGSVAERVIRHAPCPVLAVHSATKVGSGAPIEAMRFDRILVPTDFSEHSRKALDYALAFAKRAHGAIALLHVIEPPAYPTYGYAHVPTKERRLKAEATTDLTELCAIVSERGVTCNSTVRTGPAYEEIKAHAEGIDASLIIVGSRGRRGLSRAVFGSTAERVVRYANRPVLVVHEREHDFVEQETRSSEPD